MSLFCLAYSVCHPSIFLTLSPSPPMSLCLYITVFSFISLSTIIYCVSRSLSTPLCMCLMVSISVFCICSQRLSLQLCHLLLTSLSIFMPDCLSFSFYLPLSLSVCPITLRLSVCLLKLSIQSSVTPKFRATLNLTPNDSILISKYEFPCEYIRIFKIRLSRNKIL